VIVVFTEGEREIPPQCNSFGMDVFPIFHFQLEAKILCNGCIEFVFML
jgi:hypothetical protein